MASVISPLAGNVAIRLELTKPPQQVTVPAPASAPAAVPGSGAAAGAGIYFSEQTAMSQGYAATSSLILCKLLLGAPPTKRPLLSCRDVILCEAHTSTVVMLMARMYDNHVRR